MEFNPTIVAVIMTRGVKIFLSIPDAALAVRDPVLKMSPEERNIVQEQLEKNIYKLAAISYRKLTADHRLQNKAPKKYVIV